MSTTSEIPSQFPIELRIKGESAEPSRHPWACLRFLSEAELVTLLQDRLGQTETEVRQGLKSHHRAPSPV